jgi:putative aldouronate transport system permease protein
MNIKTKDKIFDTSMVAITLITVIICIIPFFYIIAISFSSNSAIVAQKVTLFPVGFNLDTYKTVFGDKSMIYSLFYTIILTFGFTILSMIFTICAAYPLTKSRLKGKNAVLMLMIFTMYFGGGLIPDYLLVKNLNLLDTPWSLILPGLVSVYNMIILKSFFTSLPESLEEAAAIDGCNDMVILFRIVLPLSTPVLATLSLFYAVGRWNGFMDALFYISKPNLYPLQMKLYQIISVSQAMDAAQQNENLKDAVAPESLKAASVMFATIPILLVYPWLQRYFVSGVMVGAVKG